jgi:hypothetical protein
VTSANACEVISAKASHVASSEATHVASAKATHVTTAEAAHVASAATAVSSSTASAAGLCARGKKAAGKHRACQNHHHSSSHDILLFGWAEFPPQTWSDGGVYREGQTPTSRWIEDGGPILRLY